MSIAADTKARIKWQEPDGNQGHGGWLDADLARAAARIWKQDEPRRLIWVESMSGVVEEVKEEVRGESL